MNATLLLDAMPRSKNDEAASQGRLHRHCAAWIGGQGIVP
jgi:hypothetical protein